MVNRNQPLSDQIHRELLNWIQSDKSEGNSRGLPSEAELAEMFSTSRATIREALSRLENERLVIRRQGSGTFISPAFPKLSKTINKLIDPLLMIGGNGKNATIGSLQYSLDQVRENSAHRLKIKPGDQAVHLHILYMQDDAPAAEMQAVIPVFKFYKDQASLPHFTNLIRFVSEVSGWNATHCITALRAVGATEQQASLLQVPAGQPLLVLEELFLTDLGNPAFDSTLYLLSNKVELDLLRNAEENFNQIAIW
jgi:GntR family transcriptional regulator